MLPFPYFRKISKQMAHTVPVSAVAVTFAALLLWLGETGLKHPEGKADRHPATKKSVAFFIKSRLERAFWNARSGTHVPDTNIPQSRYTSLSQRPAGEIP
jgi:hypothetical protein